MGVVHLYIQCLFRADSIILSGVLTISTLNTLVHFWLHHTRKVVSARLCTGSASAERVGQREVGGVTAGWHAHGGH